MKQKMLVLLLAAALLWLSLSACGGETQQKKPSEDGSAAVTAAETEDPLYGKLADQDYLGRTLRISISTNSTEWSTSSDYVMGPEELTGESIRDLVYQRNRKISEMLNLKLSWVRTDLYFDGVAPYVRKMVSSGDDAVDLIINDQYGLIEVMQEGMLLNVYDLIRDSFDFSADGWYNDFMDQLSVGSSRRFLLAGDAFIDILRGTHALYFSTAILDNLYGDREIIYKAVDDGSWTIEKMTAMIEESYDDLDGNGRPSAGDRFGIFMTTRTACCSTMLPTATSSAGTKTACPMWTSTWRKTPR